MSLSVIILIIGLQCCFKLMNNQNKAHNQKLRRNNQIFVVLMIISQIAFSILYGFFYSANPAPINISAIINVIALAILVVAGFGLVFSYLKRLIWSGLGFTFLITSLSIVLYPLINNFWAKTQIHRTAIKPEWNQSTFKIFVSNSNATPDQFFGNCISNGLKCALAVAVAFSSILGRVGALECYIVTVIGTIGFELNRQVILTVSNDVFGTYFIFTFGGFMGLALGIILRICREKLENGCSTSRNTYNQSNSFNSSMALFGSLIIFAFLPFLAYSVENTNAFNIFYLYTGPVSLMLGMAASLIGSLCVSIFFNGNIIVRDIVHAPIAGGIVVGSASAFITNPVFALVAGFTGGLVQSLIQNLIQKPYMKEKSVISTISWSLFGVQGLLGGAFASGYQKIVQNSSNGFLYNSSILNLNPGFQLLAAIVSAGIGLGFGLIAALLIILVPNQKGSQHFYDRTYWINDDGITPKGNPNQILQRTKSIKQTSRHPSRPEGPAPPPTPRENMEMMQSKKEEEKSQAIKQKNVRVEYSEVVPFDVSTPLFEMSFSQGLSGQLSHAYL